MADAKKLELVDMIRDLREQLIQAQGEGEGKAVRFLVEDVELELDIAVEEQAEGKLSAKFYVLTSHLKGTKKDMVTQRIKLKLKPNVEDLAADTNDNKRKPMSISGTVPK